MLLKYSAGVDISYKTFRACLVTYDDSQEVKVVGSKKLDSTSSCTKKHRTSTSCSCRKFVDDQ